MKIALIYNFDPSAWVSCQRITRNLAAAYHSRQELQVKDFHFDGIQNFKLWETINAIVGFRPDQIVYLDHRPHPLEFHRLLWPKLLINGQKPGVTFHLYGDFTLDFARWKQLGDILVGVKVRWYAASTRQKWMLEKLFQQKVSVCPFPFSHQDFQFNPDIRKKLRADMGINENKHIFLYTGRLSEQKRIGQLIKSFHRHTQNDKDAELWLVGNFDDISETFIGKSKAHGKYKQKIDQILGRVQDPRIVIINFCSSDVLAGLYHVADCFVSFSVHNDEDFGMSVLEAGVTGLPLFLTSWGGFKDFVLNTNHPHAHLIGVQLSPQGKKLNAQDLKAGWKKMRHAFSVSERQKISQVFYQQYSVATISKQIVSDLNALEAFSGFTKLMENLVLRERYMKTPFKSESSETFNQLYSEVYEQYTR